jgi:hypothetical protein
VSNFLSKLNLTQLKRPQGLSAQEKRRSNLVAKLQEQAALAKATAAGEKFVVVKQAWTRDDAGNKTRIERQKKVVPWFWQDGNGISLVVRYGARPLEFKKGMRAISVANIEAIPETISTIVAAVNGGELDAAIDALVNSAKAKSKA